MCITHFEMVSPNIISRKVGAPSWTLTSGLKVRNLALSTSELPGHLSVTELELLARLTHKPSILGIPALITHSKVVVVPGCVV
jgi:nitrate reductase assembly molybdenum cofactor insertion protein NarJ